MKRLWIKFVASLPLGQVSVFIENGKAQVKRGKIGSVLVSELQQLADSNGIDVACIHATEIVTSGFRLSFTGIPGNLHQRFRNAWAANWR